jgi:hypothetical protein
MRRLLFSFAVIVGFGWATLAPAMATSLGLPGHNSQNVTATLVEKVGYWKRQYRRYGYYAPYAYYPPAYGFYPPPAAYAYPPAVYGYQLPPDYAYSPPAYGHEGPPPAADGNYPSAEGDHGNFPSANGDYPSADGDYGDYPADGS